MYILGIFNESNIRTFLFLFYKKQFINEKFILKKQKPN